MFCFLLQALHQLNQLSRQLHRLGRLNLLPLRQDRLSHLTQVGSRSVTYYIAIIKITIAM